MPVGRHGVSQIFFVLNPDRVWNTVRFVFPRSHYICKNRECSRLLTKFKTQTKDDDQKILSLISDFQKIKDSLPSSERDITKYPYTKLKNVIANKKSNKEVDEIVTSFKKKEKGIETADLKKNINKFLDIKSALPTKGKELEEMWYLDLVKFVRDNYGKYLNKILLADFCSYRHWFLFNYWNLLFEILA